MKSGQELDEGHGVNHSLMVASNSEAEKHIETIGLSCPTLGVLKHQHVSNDQRVRLSRAGVKFQH